MEWLIEQAKVASPFVAMFSLLVSGFAVKVLWAQHQQDQKTILELSAELKRSMTATARALARLAAMIDSSKQQRGRG